MHEVMAFRDARQAKLESHPFFSWLHSDRVPIRDRFQFSVSGVYFIAQFRDMSRWVLRFEDPANELEWIITHGTYEDEKHSQVFLETWRELELDTTLGWRTSDLLWWMFLSPDQEVFRANGIEFIALSVLDGGDPLVRFGHHEGGEATGHVMLRNSAQLTPELTKLTGRQYRYFSPVHLSWETGHVGNIEGVFETVELDPGRRELAMSLCERIFNVFDRVFDGFLDYAHRYIESGTVPHRPPAARIAADDWTTPQFVVQPVDHFDEVALAALESAAAKVADHPFYRWLSTESELSPLQKLQRFVPMWVFDIMGYPDLHKFALAYPPDSTDPACQEVTGLAQRLATHSHLFLNDWDALRLDDILDFNASESLEWLFLDQDMDPHRRHMIEFAKHGIRYSNPAIRWWMIVALELSGAAFFANTAPLARAVEEQTGARLDYLCGRHEPPGLAAPSGHPPARLTPESLPVVQDIITAVFAAIDQLLTRSLAVAKANKWNVA